MLRAWAVCSHETAGWSALGWRCERRGPAAGYGSGWIRRGAGGCRGAVAGVEAVEGAEDAEGAEGIEGTEGIELVVVTSVTKPSSRVAA